MPMPLTVFELRGVYVFRYDGDEPIPPAIADAHNEFEDRYEVPDRGTLDALPVKYEVVSDVDADAFRVAFLGDPPQDVPQGAVFVEDGPMRTTVLCPDEAAVADAVAAGGERVGDPAK